MNNQQILPISILYEDDALLVIDKPAGMIVNKSDTARYHTTVQEWAEQREGYYMSDTTEEDLIFQSRSGIAHRIDKETSGILLIAKTPSVLLDLMAQFKAGTIKKTYLALTHGKIVPATGEINVPLGRLPWNRKRFGVLPQGRESLTRYQVKEYRLFKANKKEEIVSLVEAYPQTGRTHQIRVHFLHIGHPLFADPLYAGRKNMKLDRKYVPRLFLHAHKISFMHPETKKEISIVSDLPEELSVFLEQLEPLDAPAR